MLSVLEKQDKQEVRNQLALYKERGQVKFDMVLSIPQHERIQALITLPDGRERVSAALSASIKSAFEALNLRVGMNVEQILDLADEIIDQSEEDNLGLEDVLLFLQQMITGKAGKIYDRMDIPTFFEMFETYREQRHQSLISIRDEREVNYKVAGDTKRSSEDQEGVEVDIRKTMVDHYKNETLKNETKS